MNVVLSVILFLAGLALVIYFAEKLVKGVMGTSAGFGISAFLISVVFIGFDPENLAVGAVGSFEEVSGIALGSIIGAAMVAIALAFGVTALIVPMEFERAPRSVLSVPLAAVVLFVAVAWNGTLSRLDGGILLIGFVAAVLCLIWQRYLLLLIATAAKEGPEGDRSESFPAAIHAIPWKLLSPPFEALSAVLADLSTILCNYPNHLPTQARMASAEQAGSHPVARREDRRRDRDAPVAGRA